jgi:hypothetical protein
MVHFSLEKKNIIGSFDLSIWNLTPAHFSSIAPPNVTLYRLLTPGLITYVVLPPACLLFPNKPLPCGGQNPGQLFTLPPYGVCFSIDPQMTCYYSGGAENYMTKPGLFPH